MPVKAINVLVYAGTGTSADSVRHTLLSLRRLLSPHFAVSTVTADVLVKEPWMTACALLVIPGGADVPYCRALDGEGNRRIAQYVRRGGAFLGFCAGGYYGSQRCEFEVHNRAMAVVGARELAFFPGTCRGAAFGGFQYGSEDGAHAPKLSVHVPPSPSPGEGGGRGEGYSFRPYFNGGGVFVDAAKHRDRGVEVLASYDGQERLDVEGGDAAVVYCKVGDGSAILTGPHPEYSGYHLDRRNGGAAFAGVVDAVTQDDAKRIRFLLSLLLKLGLRVPAAGGDGDGGSGESPPRLSPVYLTCFHPPDVAPLVGRLQAVATVSASATRIVDENDTFVLHDRTLPSLRAAEAGKEEQGEEEEQKREREREQEQEQEQDLDRVPTHLHYHTASTSPPPPTPFFDHALFYDSLAAFRTASPASPSQFGSFLFYGQTVTSTNTLLDRNPKLVSMLPHGLTFAATTQVAGRGRGSNVWISPRGSLIFSTLLHHALELSQTTAPVVFVQYLVALAVAEAVRTYAPGCSAVPVRLKWPNDIYALDPSENEYVKIGGILVNSFFRNNTFSLVVGVGLNTQNSAPTTSLNHLRHALNPPLPPEFSQERLLARILVVFDEMYSRFCRAGWHGGGFDVLYEREWLHSGQLVTLEMHDGVKAIVLGVTHDCGMLRVRELGSGRIVDLVSDGNSFDFFRGLVKRKT